MRFLSRRTAAAAAGVLGVAALAFWWLTRADPLPASAIPKHTADRARGEVLYHAGSCFALHH